MDAADQQTCGKGLAENAVLPQRLGSLIAAMAENLNVHMKALDREDPNSRAEYNAYEGLVKELQQTAAQLNAIAGHMAGYRELPMGRHEEEAMKHPRVLEAFEKFVEQKREFLSLLEQTTERDDKLLQTMRSHSQ